jgi:hypothetical protein
MRRRNRLLAAALTAAVMIVTALAARAEPTEPGDPSDIPVAGTTVTETTAPDISITATTDEPESTVDWSATDEYGSTVYAPTTTTTKGPTTTTKKTARTEPPFVVNPAHPEDTYNGPTPWRDLPNFYVAVTDENGNEVTRPAPETSYEETHHDLLVAQGSTSAQEGQGSFTDFPEETERPAVHWAAALGAGAVLLAALVGVIFLLARGRRGGGEDDYVYEDEQ